MVELLCDLRLHHAEAEWVARSGAAVYSKRVLSLTWSTSHVLRSPSPCRTPARA